MKFDEDLSAVHAYLCADGYVIRNPETQKTKYYRMGLRNTNFILLHDFQQRFFRYFGVRHHLRKGQRCEIGSKQIYFILTENFSYYSYEWKMPVLPKRLLGIWLRAYFDCEGWVECQKTKSRLIRAECVNEKAIRQVQKALLRLGISSTLKLRVREKIIIWRLTICDLNNFKKFQRSIGFIHPRKKKLLEDVMSSYKTYFWSIPLSKKNLFRFVRLKGKINRKRGEIRFWSIVKKNLLTLHKNLATHHIFSVLGGPWVNQHGSVYYCLVISIRRKKNKQLFHSLS